MPLGPLKKSIKRPGPSQANFWSLLNDLVWILGKSLVKSQA